MIQVVFVVAVLGFLLAWIAQIPVWAGMGLAFLGLGIWAFLTE